MKRLPILGALLVLVSGLAFLHGDDTPPPKKTAKEALQAFNDLIGSWRGTGQPQVGTKEEKDKNFWQETIAWEWQFKEKDAWLKAKFEKSKYFDSGELRYLPDSDRYQLTLRTVNKEALVFEGQLKDKRLTLERSDDAKKESQRLVVSLLHSNRYLYRYEVKSGEQTLFTAQYQVGATKEGVEFAGGDGKPVCVVSGGLGTMPVTYQGKTYYVCCSGCRDAFKDDPETYIKDFEAKQSKKKE
jgi:YHS domain